MEQSGTRLEIKRMEPKWNATEWNRMNWNGSKRNDPSGTDEVQLMEARTLERAVAIFPRNGMALNHKSFPLNLESPSAMGSAVQYFSHTCTWMATPL